MTYYQKVLQAGEKVKYIGHLHWICYSYAIVFAIVSVCAIIFSLNPAHRVETPPILLAVPMFLACVTWFSAWFRRVTTEIVVTDQRIIHKTGWIARQTQEMNITKVETVDVNQGITGRILGYGAIGIRGIGGSWEPLRRIASPLALRNAIMVG